MAAAADDERAPAVEDLIIDDGVPNRGHRLCIYDAAYHAAGVAVGEHASFGAMVAIEFAGAYDNDAAAIAARTAAGPPLVGKFQPSLVKTATHLGGCGGCKKPIRGGSVVEAGGKKYHRDCFCCGADGCAVNLAGVPFMTERGLMFCKPCWAVAFGKKCAGCKNLIEGKYVVVGKESWHKECRGKGGAKGGGGGGRGWRGRSSASTTTATTRASGGTRTTTTTTTTTRISGARARGGRGRGARGGRGRGRSRADARRTRAERLGGAGWQSDLAGQAGLTALADEYAALGL